MSRRAMLSFVVTHGRHRLRVRLLPTVADVDREYRDGRRRRGGRLTYAFFRPAPRAGSPLNGTAVFPADGNLLELVPHEVAHAVMYRLGGAHSACDEPLAEAIGKLSARILTRIRDWQGCSL